MSSLLIRRAALLGTLALSLGACTTGFDPANQAQVRFLHVSPDAPALDFYIAQQREAAGLGYRTATTYAGVEAGSWAVQVTRGGEGAPLATVQQQLRAGMPYTVLATGLLGQLSITVLADDMTAPTAGQSRLRFVHAAPAFAAVDVYVTAPGADIGPLVPTVANLARHAASAYLDRLAGPLQVRFTTAGTKIVVLDSGALTTTAGAVRTLLALDRNGGGQPLQLGVLAEQN